MKWKTIRAGEQAVIFNHLGEGRLVAGPERVFLFRERIHFLTYHTATSLEYLEVKNVSGEVVHIPGPCEMFHNPLDQKSIKTGKGIRLDANHILVVYRKNKKDNSVERRIVQGPTVFIPTAEEWLHEFEWHGENINETGTMVPANKKFKELSFSPEYFHYNIRDVRTNDDIIIKINMMLLYELKDIVKMLSATQDPIADMINAICADVIAFVGKLTFAKFLQSTEKLNKMENFPRLSASAERIGYQINSVVYIGYRASDQLQLMQDQAIKSRTQLRLNTEIEEQKQKLADFKLKKEKQRTELKNKMQKDKLEHQQNISTLKQEQGLAVKQKEQEISLQILSLEGKLLLEMETEERETQAEYLKQLKALHVDLTRYLANESGGPIHQEYRFITSGPISDQQVGKIYPIESTL